MKKITISLDVSKISKDKIVERTYKNKEGEDVKQKVYKFDVIELNQQKVIASGDTWKMLKTHFCVEQQTKEEKEAKVPQIFVGEGLSFENN
jgi:uncharacterized membrane-anchored protein